MKVTKFFRRYSRTLLIIAMSLLLVAFLIPTSISSYRQRGEALKATIGEAFGQPVTTTDVLQMQTEQQLLVRLNQRIPNLDVLDLYLLEEESRQMGIRVSRDEIKD